MVITATVPESLAVRGAMKWITRRNIKIDRVACPWLIRRFVDPEAQFLFVDESELAESARKENAIPFDAPLSVDKTKSEPDSGLTRGEAGLFGRAEWSSPAARKGITLGFKATTQTPISSCGTPLARTERFLQAACCQSYR
jgi:hypothetical protein